MEDLTYIWFKRKILKLTGIDLEGYRNPQMHRRINFIMKKTGAKTFVEYYKILEKDKNALENFENFITINVSTLFRDPNKWIALEEKYLPLLIENRKENYLKIWSAGCANGAEVYSIMIILKELLRKSYNLNYKIIATDIDKNILQQAKEGVFNKIEIVNVKGEFLKKHFKESGNGLFKIKEEIKKGIDFKIHNVQDEPIGKDFDLIICRNVLIYFTEEAKNKICKKFADSLRERGILLLGATEIIFNSNEIGLKNLSGGFYQKQNYEEN